MQQQIIEQKNLIKDAVNKVFEGVRVEKDFSSEHYRIIDMTTRKICLQFEFVDHESTTKRYPSLPRHPKYKDLTVLHILHLSKCGANSGNTLLRLVDELAQSIPFVEHITLTDASNVKKCNKGLILPHLRILTSDRWGYKSPIHHAGNMHVNSELRNGNMREFLDINPLLRSAVMDAFPELNTNVTVHQYVKAIYEQIRSFPEEDGCDDEQFKKISALQMLIGKLNVEYYKELFKTVEHGSRGGSKRSASKRSASKRSASKRSAKKRITKKRITKKSRRR
jgi:hypothetical protein